MKIEREPSDPGHVGSDSFTTVLLCTQKRGSLGLIMIGVTNIEAY